MKVKASDNRSQNEKRWTIDALTKEFNKKLSWSRFKKICKIGEGAWSIVYKEFDKQTQKSVAIKVFKERQFKSKKVIKNLFREVRNLKNVSNRPDYKNYFVQLIDQVILETKSGQVQFCLIMELQQMSLSQYLKSNLYSNLLLHEKLSLCIGIAYAIYLLHDINIIHRDIKPDNILMRSQYAPVLSDFGLSKDVKDGSMTLDVGTPIYKHPDIEKLRIQYTKEYDLYSFGLIIFEVLTGRFICQLEESMDKQQVWKKIRQVLLDINNTLQNVQQFEGEIGMEIQTIIKECISLKKDIKFYGIIERLRTVQNKLEFKYIDSIQQLSCNKKTTDTNSQSQQTSQTNFLEEKYEHEINEENIMDSKISRSQNIKISKISKRFNSTIEGRNDQTFQPTNEQAYSKIKLMAGSIKFDVELSEEEDEFQVDYIKLMLKNKKTKIEKQFQKKKEEQSKIKQKVEQYKKKYKQIKQWEKTSPEDKYKKKILLLGLLFMRNRIIQEKKKDQLMDKINEELKAMHLVCLKECQKIKFQFHASFRKFLAIDYCHPSKSQIIDQFNYTIVTSGKLIDQAAYSQFFK